MTFQISLGELLIAAGTILAPMLSALLLLHRSNTARMNEMLSLLKQYPLHLHINGKIVYPAGLTPGVVAANGEIQNGK